MIICTIVFPFVRSANTCIMGPYSNVISASISRHPCKLTYFSTLFTNHLLSERWYWCKCMQELWNWDWMQKNILLRPKYMNTTYIRTNLLKYENTVWLFSGKPSDKFCISQTRVWKLLVSVKCLTICINI